MYSSNLKFNEVVLDPDTDADEKTIAWLKRDLERRRAERGETKGELVSTN